MEYRAEKSIGKSIDSVFNLFCQLRTRVNIIMMEYEKRKGG